MPPIGALATLLVGGRCWEQKQHAWLRGCVCLENMKNHVFFCGFTVYVYIYIDVFIYIHSIHV